MSLIFEELRAFLINKGCSEQSDGVNYINGSELTNFLTLNGEVITICCNDMPDDEQIDELFPYAPILQDFKAELKDIEDKRVRETFSTFGK